MADDRLAQMAEAVAAARLASRAVEAERDLLDAELDRGKASFSAVAAANGRVRRAREALLAAEAALEAMSKEDAG